MGQQHQHIHSTGNREGIDDASPPGQHSTGAIVGNYIYHDMMSPNSLLRSDRFTRGKSTGVAAAQEEEAARVFEQQLSSREDKANNSASGKWQEITSPMTEAANITRRRDRAPTISAESGFDNIRKRGKAPAKVRPIMTAGTFSTVYSHGQQQGCEQNGEHYSRPSQATPSPKNMSDGFFSDMPAFKNDSDASSHKIHRGQSSSSPSGGSGTTETSQRAQLSQSPLRPASSPMRSKPGLTKVGSDRMATRKNAEMQPSSQLDEWSSRCFNLSQQIVEHLRSWNQSFSDGQISSSPMMSTRSHYSLKSASRDPLSVTRTLLEEFDQHATSMDSLSQARQVYSIVSVDQ